MATSGPNALALSEEATAFIVRACCEAYPDVQAVYIFGSQAGGVTSRRSDCDVAVLLPPETARRAGMLALSELHQVLERRLRLDVDLVNLRQATTVFAKEIVTTGVRIASADPSAADEFEALTLSLYQELNVERSDLLREFERTGVAFAP